MDALYAAQVQSFLQVRDGAAPGSTGGFRAIARVALLDTDGARNRERGVYARARRVAKGADAEMTVIDQSNYHLFRPLL